MTLLYAFLGLLALVALYVILTYNALVSLKVKVEAAWSDIEVQMKRRYNLIPNLVEAVKGYMGHERGTLESVTKARAEAIANQGTPPEQARSENALTAALRSLFAVAENYPDLKANQNFLDLQDELSQLEEAIQGARRYYNGSVRNLNTKTAQFPSNLVARAFRFLAADFFELEEGDAAARQPVQVGF